MKNHIASWFRSLIAFDNGTLKKEFSIVDPTSADSRGLSTVTLSVDPSADGSKPTMVSLYFEGSGVKLFEKQYHDDQDAQVEMEAMARDLDEASKMSKEGKTDEAKNLVNSLLTKYKRSSDNPLNNEPPTLTMTQASLDTTSYKGWSIHRRPEGDWMGEHDVMSLRADSLDALKAKIDNMVRKASGKKLKRTAGITMQNLFFDTVEEAMDFQKKTQELQGGPQAGAPAEGKPLWDQMQEDKVVPSNEPGEETEELAPANVAPDFKQIEKDKAKQDKDIGKRIKEQVKTEVESALEQKSASVFGPEQEELVDAMQVNGRNWDEIKKYFIKDLSFNEDDVTVFLDSLRHKEEPSTDLPMPPKPPEDLVSPETHDKLVKEIEEKKEPMPGLEPEIKPEPKPMADEIARADNSEIRKMAQERRVYDAEHPEWGPDHDVSPWPCSCGETLKSKNEGLRHFRIHHGKDASLDRTALNPLQEPPTVGQTPGQSLNSPVEEAPTMDAPPPAMPEGDVEPEYLEAPQQGDRVYVMGDYESGASGYEGTMASSFASKGDEYAVVVKDDGSNEEVAMHRVVKASQKKVAKAYYEKTANAKCVKCGDPVPYWLSDKQVGGPFCSHCLLAKPVVPPLTEHDLRKKESAKKCPGCGHEIWDNSTVDQRLNKCWNCGLRFDNPESEVEVESDLDVEGKANEDVIRMFLDDSFPKDKRPEWGTTNLKISKWANGWALVNYETPILYRANGSNTVVFNAQKYSVTTSKIQTQIRRMLSGQDVQETDEAGIQAAIQQSKAAPAPGETPESQPQAPLDSLHESALKLHEELAYEGKIAFYFTKEGIEKTAAEDSAFEGNGWCRVWVDDLEIESNAKYSEILKLADENARIQALKELAREIAHEALRDADKAAGKFGVQAWFESLEPSRHDRIDWAALANPVNEDEEEKKYWDKWDAEHPKAQSSQDVKVEKKADHIDDIMQHEDEGLDEQKEIEMFQRMINDGSVWHMQGSYGRRAMDFLRAGLCELGEKSFTDAYGNKVPSKYEVKPGTTGAPLETRKEASQEKTAADSVPPAEQPTTFKQWQKAPSGTDREQSVPANVEQAQVIKDIESSLTSLEAIKALVTQAKAKLAEEVKKIEEQGGRFQMEAALKEKIEKLSKMVEATQNKMLTAGDTMVRLIQENKEHAYKPSDKQKIEWLTTRLNKYEDAAKYLKQAEDGAQHLATTEQVRELYFFPAKTSKLSKKANFMETLDSIYDNVMAALALLVGEDTPSKA